MICNISKLSINTEQYLPLFTESIKAGFPSPAEEYIEEKLDLNTHLIRHPEATYFVTVSGDSMVNEGILNNDILIVDRAINPEHGKIIIAIIDGEFTVKKLYRKNNKLLLLAANPKYKAIEIKQDQELISWGVVIHAIHSF
ncbi:UNVERIFIED_CONTAM: hypothetical protein GTU68_049752 [Idotea baltica]|nr:hypothetical protein [Idotea baltica]